MPWARTIHSAAFRLLETRPDGLLVDRRYAEFAERYGYCFSGLRIDHADLHEARSGLPARTPDDQMRYVLEWGRNRRLEPMVALGRCPVDGVRATDYERFVARLSAFKAEHDLLDFTDLLERVLEAELAPDVDVAFIDEAQDLSPLQIAVVEQWFGSGVKVYVAGDDDQAIYGFQGADPGWLLKLAESSKAEVLTQSHRVPVAVHGLAARVIGRNSLRVVKSYRPTGNPGRVVHLDTLGALDEVESSTSAFVLVRNRRFMGPIASSLMSRRVPFVVEGVGGVSPLSDQELCSAVRVGGWIRGGIRSVTAADLHTLLAHVPTTTGLVPRGVKTQIKQARDKGTSYQLQELRARLGLGRLLDTIQSDGPVRVLRKVDKRTLDYLEKLIERHGHLPQPRVWVTTIHGSKGREKELVVLASDMSRATHKAYRAGGRAEFEAENRIQYVGITRALDTLILTEPATRRHYDYPLSEQVR